MFVEGWCEGGEEGEGEEDGEEECVCQAPPT